MTTTACDDQFTVGTQTIVLHQAYDTVAILRRNVADLEVALRKQKLLETVTENWQPIITIDNVDLLTNQVDVWSKKHGRIVDVTYGKETYGSRVGIVHQDDYDCDGPVFRIVDDATHWMVVKGPDQ